MEPHLHQNIEPYKNDLNSIPWLGDPPSASHDLKPPLGTPHGVYKIWCLIPPSLKKVTIYRQLLYTPKGEPKHLVIGLEFHSGISGSDTLLGFRSLRPEDIVTVTFNYHLLEKNQDRESRLTGLSVRQVDGIPELVGLEEVEVSNFSRLSTCILSSYFNITKVNAG